MEMRYPVAGRDSSETLNLTINNDEDGPVVYHSKTAPPVSIPIQVPPTYIK